jgi:glycine/D-amino acid oxidase-like deaminating enzyme
MNRRDFVRIFGVSAVAIRATSLHALTRDHIVVAGAGIMGASIAYHLVKRGARVTLLEKEAPATGTTKNSFAWLNASSKSPRSYYDLNLAGVAGWRRLELELGKDVLPVQWGGGLQWCESDAKSVESMKKHVKERAEWGYSTFMVDRARFDELLPGAQPGDFGAANFADQEGTVDPVAAAKALVEAAKKLGAEVIYPCELTDVVAGTGKITAVQTTQGKMECDYLVLATGNDTQRMAEKVGLKVPLKDSRGILAHSAPFAPTVKRVVMGPGSDIKQNFDGRVVTGANFGESGDQQPTEELGKQLLAKAAEYMPQLAGVRLEYMTLGHRVMPQDGLPIIDRSARYPNAHAVAMHSGMTLSPYIGQLVSAEVLDQVSVDVLAPYRTSRFA